MTARDRNVIAIALVLAATVAAWLMVIQPKRGEASKLGSQITAIQSQLSAAQAQLAAGEAAQRTFAADYTELARLGEAVPADDNVPSLIYQVQGAATAAGVDFRSLVFNAGAGGGSGPAPAAAASAATATSTGTTPVSATSAGAPAAPVSNAPLPPGATVGPAGFPVEPFTFTFRGSFFRLANFLGRLERFVTASNKSVSVSGRLMTLNAISLGPGTGGFPQITATVNATTYLVPAAEGLFNGATPGGPLTRTAQPVSSPTTTTSAGPPAAAIAPPAR